MMDEDLVMAIRLSQADMNAQNNQDADGDYKYALKLSEDLNGSRTVTSFEHDDYLLALKLSKEDSAMVNVNQQHSANFETNPGNDVDHSRNKFSMTTFTGGDDDFISDFSNEDFSLAVQIAESRSGKTLATSSTKPVSEIDHDFLLALQIAEQDSDNEEVDSNASYSKKQKSRILSNNQNVEKYSNKSLSVVDPSWELIDPNPDIYSLFSVFNQRFFWSRLDMVEVKWSPQMTTCAGICSYSCRAGYCVVRLSKPLLTLRPRKDLVETLLHEMIHAYLFVTKNNRDRDGHGSEFHKHMYRINKESGSNITVYHSFHDEVKYYKTHWWKCDGPCATRAPFFGLVKRARNRAPGPTDFWWTDHLASCGGTFHKIREPEGYGKKKKSNGNSVVDKTEKRASVVDLLKMKTHSTLSKSGTVSTAKTASSNLTSVEKISGVTFNPPSNAPNCVFKSSFIPTSNLTSSQNNRGIFTLSDLNQSKRKRGLLHSPSKRSKNWIPMKGQTNIFHFTNKY